MPLISSQNILFIHIPKNAGKSLEVALGAATAAEVEDYKWRSIINRAAKYLLDRSKDPRSRVRLFGMVDFHFCAQHLTYQEILLLRLIPPRELCSLTKLAVVRDPYERALSLFRHWWDGGNAREALAADFEQFCLEIGCRKVTRHNEIAHFRTQAAFVRDLSGQMAMDHILRFESLSEDFRNFVSAMKLGPVDLPKIGDQKQGRSNGWNHLLTPKAIAAIDSTYAEDFDLFGYPHRT